MSRARHQARWKNDALWVGNDARLDATLFACLGESHLPPCPPRLLLFEPGMLRRARIIERVNDRLCECLVRRGVTNGLGRRGDRRRDGRRCPRYLQNNANDKSSEN
jgi:hypothetical protein